MNTRFEHPPALSPEEAAKIEKKQAKIKEVRNLSDIRLRLEGAQQKDDKRLEVTEKQIERAQHEMQKELAPVLEKRAEIINKRNLPDIRLRLEGAEDKLDDEGGRRLEVTPKQIEEARKEMDRDLGAKQFVKEHDNWLMRKAYQIGGAGCIGWLKIIGKVFHFLKNILKEIFRATLGLGVAAGGASVAGVVGIGVFLKRLRGKGK